MEPRKSDQGSDIQFRCLLSGAQTGRRAATRPRPRQDGKQTVRICMTPLLSIESTQLKRTDRNTFHVQVDAWGCRFSRGKPCCAAAVRVLQKVRPLAVYVCCLQGKDVTVCDLSDYRLLRAGGQVDQRMATMANSRVWDDSLAVRESFG